MVEMMGYSDDVLYFQMDNFNDEVDCVDSEVHVQIMDTVQDGGVRLIWRYGIRHAMWSVDVERVGEDRPIPWPVVITNGDRSYSPRVTIDYPSTDLVVTTDIKPTGSDFS